MTRLCACDCGEPVEGRMKYRPGHRQRHHARRVRSAMRAAGLPASPSLKAAQMATTTNNRQHDAPETFLAPRRRSRKPSGEQLSYRKTLRTLAEEYRRDGYTWEAAVTKAERVLNPVLPARQRELLAQRSTERKAAA